MIETGLIAARLVHYVSLAMLFGSWAFVSQPGGDAPLRRRFSGWRINSAALVLVSGVAVLAATAAGLGGSYASLADGELWSTILGETDFGKIWTARLALALVALAAALIWRNSVRSAARLTGVATAGALAVTIAWTGHAAIEEGAAGQLHRWADAMHLIAAMVWIGAFPPLLWLLSRPETAPSALRRLVDFHAIGTAAVVTLLLTGAVNSIFLVGSPGALFDTDYGRLLAFKLLLFALMFALAALNRFRHVPSLAGVIGSGDGAAAIATLRRSIRTELTLGVLVLATVAVLGAIEPASSA